MVSPLIQTDRLLCVKCFTFSSRPVYVVDINSPQTYQWFKTTKVYFRWAGGGGLSTIPPSLLDPGQWRDYHLEYWCYWNKQWNGKYNNSSLKASSQNQHVFIFHWPESVISLQKGWGILNLPKGEENDNILNVSMILIHVFVHLSFIQLVCRRYHWSHFRYPTKDLEA